MQRLEAPLDPAFPFARDAETLELAPTPRADPRDHGFVIGLPCSGSSASPTLRYVIDQIEIAPASVE